ncbi:GH25 family lysozyme [Fusobacterium sp. PH5-44]|uniref:GH25 family lysozyme n=1 Tax=unclassified Fusobacterium TaxID=2648384 RepID=UPI003D1EC25C
MKIKKIIFCFSIFLLLFSMTFGLLVKKGIIWITTPFEILYTIKGVDVSSYQGEIDWEIIQEQDIYFAFIKATEGSTFNDRYFQKNWDNASKTNLRIGAYHFFSFDSSGKTQAENFIKTVKKVDNMLPPVVDIEFYKDKSRNPPTKEETQVILNELLLELEKHYGMKPIIYSPRSTYKRYIKGNYDEYDIWIRNLIFFPYLTGRNPWTFWQYSNKKILKGYNGDEKYIDMNFFNGNKKDFEKYNTN